MNIKPLSDRVVLELVELKQETESGIVLPDTASKGNVLPANVVAVGEGRYTDSGELIKMSVKVGDKVLIKKDYQAEEYKSGEKDYLIVREDNILGVLD